jgi:aryl-alcohol dehydrogenase-like predicted oxidoreductase
VSQCVCVFLRSARRRVPRRAARALGASGCVVRLQALTEFMEQPECDVIQIVDDYCLVRRFAEANGVLDAALAKDIGVVQAAPMYRGMLYDSGAAEALHCPEVGALIRRMSRWAVGRG